MSFLTNIYRENDFVKNKDYNGFMKYSIPLVLLIFCLQGIAQDDVRPGPHNKSGITEKSQQEKESSFIYKLFNNDFMGSPESTNNKTSNNDISTTLSQIEKLADLKKQGIITDEEFNTKKSVLLDKIQ